MKTKLFTGLAIALALVATEPVFAHGGSGGGRGGGGGGGRSFAVARSGGGGSGQVAFSGGAVRGFRGGTFATGRTFQYRPSVAFGGNSYNARAYSNGGRGNAAFAFRSHSGWNHDREYAWHGHHYRWYNNGWFLIDPFPYDYGYYGAGWGYPYYNTTYDTGDDTGSVSVQVQQELSQDGYYQGPIDGIVGPGTRAAIAAYQRDNGLAVTGNINGPLLDSLNGD